jgi:hypothetical protein
VVIISLQDFVEEKAKVEKGAIKEKSFEFTTYKKVGNVEIPTSWRGELVSDDTIKLKRLTQAGKPADEVGELTLTRAR